MRRTTSLILITTVLVAFGGTFVTTGVPGEAAEGDPGDTCSHAPDRPLGWEFQHACGAHDACIDALSGEGRGAGRLACDDVFMDDLLESRHAAATSSCQEQLVCRVLATTYYRVVRFVSERLISAGRP